MHRLTHSKEDKLWKASKAIITVTLGDEAGLEETCDQGRLDVPGGGGGNQGRLDAHGGDHQPLNPRVRGEVYALTDGGDKLLSRELTGRLAGDDHNPL